MDDRSIVNPAQFADSYELHPDLNPHDWLDVDEHGLSVGGRRMGSARVYRSVFGKPEERRYEDYYTTPEAGGGRRADSWNAYLTTENGRHVSVLWNHDDRPDSFRTRQRAVVQETTPWRASMNLSPADRPKAMAEAKDIYDGRDRLIASSPEEVMRYVGDVAAKPATKFRSLYTNAEGEMGQDEILHVVYDPRHRRGRQ